MLGKYRGIWDKYSGIQDKNCGNWRQIQWYLGEIKRSMGENTEVSWANSVYFVQIQWYLGQIKLDMGKIQWNVGQIKRD